MALNIKCITINASRWPVCINHMTISFVLLSGGSVRLAAAKFEKLRNDFVKV